jgi:hypothetical protein
MIPHHLLKINDENVPFSFNEGFPMSISGNSGLKLYAW